jgi:hypothetical protein
MGRRREERWTEGEVGIDRQMREGQREGRTVGDRENTGIDRGS